MAKKIVVKSFKQLGRTGVEMARKKAERIERLKLKPSTPKQKREPLPTVENSHFSNYKDYCNSEYFRRLKRKVLKKFKNTCVKCGSKAKTAHHEIYRERWVESKVEDCIAICNPCHMRIHGKL